MRLPFWHPTPPPSCRRQHGCEWRTIFFVKAGPELAAHVEIAFSEQGKILAGEDGRIAGQAVLQAGHGKTRFRQSPFHPARR